MPARRFILLYRFELERVKGIEPSLLSELLTAIDNPHRGPGDWLGFGIAISIILQARRVHLQNR
jgi:hypothetical protein